MEPIIEHNEARMADVEIPLWELEQRVEKVEQGLQTFQVDILDGMVDKVCVRIGKNMHEYLPRVQQMVQDFKSFKEKYEM